VLLAPELDAAGDTAAMNTEAPKPCGSSREEPGGTVLQKPASSRPLQRGLAGALIVLLLALAVVVKWAFFPSVKEDYFALNERNLQQVRSGLLVVRPTRFGRSHFNGTVWTTVTASGSQVQRIVGRNVNLRDLMATAYGHNASSIAMPSDAPQTNYDFLVTVRGKPRQKLQAAIRKSLGYTARIELHEAEVLAVKVEDASLPGLTVSEPEQKQNVSFGDGKLCFQHLRLGELAGGMEQVFRTPVVDKTGLTDFYNFCVPWGIEMQQQLQDAARARHLVEEILRSFGLALKPDTAQINMLVVKKEMNNEGTK
jgi:uncharacterized protein (TIGR03435 family)